MALETASRMPKSKHTQLCTELVTVHPTNSSCLVSPSVCPTCLDSNHFTPGWPSLAQHKRHKEDARTDINVW